MCYNLIGGEPFFRCLEVIDLTRKATERDIQNAINDYVLGDSIEVAAPRHHISQPRLSQLLKDAGLFRNAATRNAIKGPKISANSSNRITLPSAMMVQRYEAGESENAIAQSFGVARSVIRRCLREEGVTLRTNASANRLMMTQRTPEQHRAYTSRAHAANRGRPVRFEVLCRKAATLQRLERNVSPAERLLALWLRDRGIDAVPQFAIGPYNADLGTYPVAVEIYGGNWHTGGRHSSRAPKRLRYLFDQGWSVMVVYVDNRTMPLTERAADEVAAFVQQSRRNPTLGSQYRVIGGNGQPTPRYRLDVNDFPDITTLR